MTRPSKSARRHGTVWPAAFAILLVANLLAPAAGVVPRGSVARRPEPVDDSDAASAISAGTHADRHDVPPPPANAPVDDVVVRPVNAPAIKSSYDLVEMLRAFAAWRAPFRHAGADLLDLHAMTTGDDVDPDTRKAVDKWTGRLDVATGLIPDVGMARVPAEVADMAADELEGHHPNLERIIPMLELASPRNVQRPDGAHERPHHVREAARRRLAVRQRQGAPRRAGGSERSRADTETYRVKASTDELPGPTHFVQPYRGPAPSSHLEWYMEGEIKHLRGYAETLPKDRIPRDPHRLSLVDGRRYLRGASGFYRITKGDSEHQWYVCAPPGSAQAASVPVIFDPGARRWRAEAPMRLRGGGGGDEGVGEGGGGGFARDVSLDSIARDYRNIAGAITHLDARLRTAIENAFESLSQLHLSRSNREDLKFRRDNTIINHRAALRASMQRIKRDTSLLSQQVEAARITNAHYDMNAYSEAFCQENAEILFHHLVKNRVPTKRLRMITIHPQNRPPHVMVLYTESERLIELLESATLHPEKYFGFEGINHMLFAFKVFESRASTVLLDGWSRARATSFALASGASDMVARLYSALADIGHLPGTAFRVSITRPLGARVGSARRQGPTGSSGSEAGSSRSGSTDSQASQASQASQIIASGSGRARTASGSSAPKAERHADADESL